MRIRKRFLSLSAALAASPPSDHFDHQPPSSSDHITQIGLQLSTKELESEKKKKEIEIIKTDDDIARNKSILCEKGKSHDLGWVEGDRVIPVKKRRGSIGKSRLNLDIKEDNEMIEGKMKSKAKNNKKNEKRGNVKMEGSRCSRVNGRGWRCAQQTLVGYSLCEHHLGKGRLRSMSNVRGREQKAEVKEPDIKEDEKLSMDHHDLKDDVKEFKDCEEDEVEEEEQVSSSVSMVNIGKRRKLGVVKARSLSSLLSQTAN